MSARFERFCLAAGFEALAEMMGQDALGGLRRAARTGSSAQGASLGQDEGQDRFPRR